MGELEQAPYGSAERVLVLIPTYDEAENIRPVVSRLRRAVPAADVLVVDDASPDGTGAIADAIAAGDSQVHVLHRSAKDGLGRAYLAGFSWGLDRGYDVLVEMDADGSHRPEQLHRLLDALRHADLVIGSRWVDGGGVQNWPRRRELLSRGGSWYSRNMLDVPVRDVTAGYRAFRSDALTQIELADVASAGYCFQVDLTRRAVRLGLRVVEVPITFVEREYGVSKMNGVVVREALVRVTQWGIAHRAGQFAARLSGRDRGHDRERSVV